MMMKSLVAMLLLAANIKADPVGTNVPFTNGIFQDPYSTNPQDLLLGISVDTHCPNSLKVLVHVPADAQGQFAADADLASTHLAGSYQGHIAGADVAIHYFGDGRSDWTFSNFEFIETTALPTPFNPSGYRIVVDVTNLVIANKNNGFHVDPTNTAVQFDSHDHPSRFEAIIITEDCKGGGGLNGDPQFAGFQGQNFQFHGMADEVFSLISTPTFQMNGNFKYISSGKCDYNDTVCFTHPGTYVDQTGFIVGETSVKALSGSHETGMRVWINDVEIHRSHNAVSVSEDCTLTLNKQGHLILDVPQFRVEIVNSDYFFNMEVALKDAQILRMGAKKTKLHDAVLCKSSGMKSSDRLAVVEERMAKHYPRVEMHGLIGQTWRNAVICDHAWVGDASDYVVSDLFATDSAFNYYGTK